MHDAARIIEFPTASDNAKAAVMTARLMIARIKAYSAADAPR